MVFKRNIGLKAKIAIPILLVSILAVIIELVLSLVSIKEELGQEFKSKGVALARSLSSSVQDTILNRDASTVQGFIDQYREIKNVSYIYITNENNEIIAHTFSPSIPEGLLEQTSLEITNDEADVIDFVTTTQGRETLAIVSPILSGLLGKVHLGMDIQFVNDNVIIPAIKKGIISTLTILAIEFSMLMFILSKFIGPISEITKTSKEIVESKNLETTIEYNGNDEVGELVNVFNMLIKELKSYTENLEAKVTNRTKDLNQSLEELEKSKQEQEQLYKKLLETARYAGMAEVATSVLHNVGNILNSVNISAETCKRNLAAMDIKKTRQLSDLLEANKENLGAYFSNNEKAKKIPDFLKALVSHNEKTLNSSVEEIIYLLDKVEHIKRIITSQQGFAKSTRVIEEADVLSLVKESIQINQEGLNKYKIKVSYEESGNLKVKADTHEILQVFVNIISNAKNAMVTLDRDKIINIKLDGNNKDNINVVFKDNGVGIGKENLTKIFEYGFTTRKDGHGFGLHSCANTIKEMGGELRVNSEGLDKGAEFTVSFPRVVSAGKSANKRAS